MKYLIKLIYEFEIDGVEDEYEAYDKACNLKLSNAQDIDWDYEELDDDEYDDEEDF